MPTQRLAEVTGLSVIRDKLCSLQAAVAHAHRKVHLLASVPAVAALVLARAAGPRAGWQQV